ncbi:MAG: UDP-N-acetylmuramate dehydrogenase [Bacteroidota bacterium]
MQIKTNVSLQPFNTFGIAAQAAHFVKINSVAELQRIVQQPVRPIYLLGGGSNLLLTKTVDGLVIKNNILGKHIVRRFKKSVYVKVGAGENWHDFVMWCIEQNLGGVENLSLIPGTVGAAPIQNIGAYGVELVERFHQLEAVDLADGKVHRFRKKDCQFAYRDSIFKNKWKGRFGITGVWFKLSTQAHDIRTAYGAIRQELEKQQIKDPSIRQVSDAVIRIRQSKLPDPAILGNSGSFFKNPVISTRQFVSLQRQFSHLVFYDLGDGKYKIPAGWLIEQCGWKGKKIGRTGTHEKQALVLVNHGGATGKEIYQLAQAIQYSVKEKYNIQLDMEVNVW